MADSIYSSFIQTKNNSTIPVLKSGKTLESKYNPQRDAENIINSLDKQYNAFLVLGAGSGILIEALRTNYPDSLIIIFENSSDDFDFLYTNSEINNRINTNKAVKTNLTNLKDNLINNYLPARYGDLKIIDFQNWNMENSDKLPEIKNCINEALNIIGADFSAQAHFGKIWTSNFFKNLKLLCSNSEQNNPVFTEKKKAVVFAAGPSVDELVYKYQNSNDYFVVSTDTAFPTLLKHHIKPDVVVSLDGQTVTQSHFINSHSFKDINFYLDITGNSSAAKYILSKNGNLHYFISGNPLSTALNLYSHDSMLQLYAGTGTVTIAAVDLAIKTEIKEIELCGADFSYHKGKAYTKGTYLDTLYNLKASKIETSEKTFDRLQYRTPLTQINEKQYTTSTLNSYKDSFIKWLNNCNCEYEYKDFTYYIKSSQNLNLINKKTTIEYEGFINFLENIPKKEREIIFLPLISYFRMQNSYKSLDYGELIKLAQEFVQSFK